MEYFWILFSLQVIFILKTNAIQSVEFYPGMNEEFVYVINACDDSKITKWKSDFHECFYKKKYEDGGRNLESIVDRILGHAEACVETSGQNCRPDFDGFKNVLGKVLEQMKEYSNLYLEAIFSGRDKFKDLKCVEETLTLDVYQNCFSGLPAALKKTDYEIKESINDGIRCTNEKNLECSKEARSSLNRIVRSIYSMEQPAEEEEMAEKPKPPPSKRWYEYVTEPIVTAWEAIKNFFSNTFG